MEQIVTYANLYAPNLPEGEFIWLYEKWERQQFKCIMGYDMPAPGAHPLNQYSTEEEAL